MGRLSFAKGLADSDTGQGRMATPGSAAQGRATARSPAARPSGCYASAMAPSQPQRGALATPYAESHSSSGTLRTRPPAQSITTPSPT